MSVYGAYAKFSIKDELKHFFTDAFWNGGLGALYVSIIFGLYVASGKSSFFGAYELDTIAWYLIAAQLVIMTKVHLAVALSDEIQEGNILLKLNKPYHFPLALFGEHCGRMLVTTISGILWLVPLGFLLTDKVSITLSGVVAFLCLLLLAGVLDFVISLCIGLIAFWTESSRPYVWIYHKLLFILGGLFFPLALYPEFLQRIALALPPAFTVFYPAQTLVAFSWSTFLHAVLGVLAYTVAIGVLAWWLYGRAVRKVSINGG